METDRSDNETVNLSSSSNTTEGDLPVHFRYATFVYIRVIGACVFAVVGCPLNVTALVVIRRSSRRMSTQSRLLSYLCCVETLICVWALPMFAYDQWSMAGLHSPVFCRANVFIYFNLQGNVPIAFLLIAGYRFLLVVRRFPALGRQTGEVAVWGSITAGVLTVLVILVPPLFDVGGLFRQSEITGICTSLIRPHTKLYNSLTQGLLLLGPLILMSGFYGFILRTVRAQNRKIAAINAGVLNIPDVRESMLRRKYRIRVTLLSAISVLVFTVTYTPFILGTLLPSHLDTYMYSAVTTVITFSHTVTSPLLYVCGDSELRKTLKKLCACARRQQRPEVACVHAQCPLNNPRPPEVNNTEDKAVETQEGAGRRWGVNLNVFTTDRTSPPKNPPPQDPRNSGEKRTSGSGDRETSSLAELAVNGMGRILRGNTRTAKTQVQMHNFDHIEEIKEHV